MIDARLSRDIEVGAIARPRYSTDVITMESGAEFRVPRWRYPLFTFEFDLEPGNQDTEDDEEAELAAYQQQTLRELVNLWHCAGGMGETFLFRHWGDYRAVDNLIGLGDGATTEFQLYRVYTVGAVSRQRKITRPVAGTVTAEVNGVPTAVTVDTETGLITFGAPPANTAQITASFEFDLPVRFDSDSIELVALTLNLDQPVNITLVEVRERTAA